MNRSDEINELAGAFAKAQADLPAVPKRGKGQVGTAKTTYATLDDVIDTVRGPLSENGLSFTQMLDTAADGPALTTMLLHSSGQWMASSTPIDAMDGNRGTNAMQAFGSTLTYLKRYALSAMLGVTTDEDDDGSAARKPPQRPPAKPKGPPQTKPPHWIDDETTRKRFWAWAAEKGLNDEDVHAALKVEHIRDYGGAKADAVAAITTWLSEQPFTED